MSSATSARSSGVALLLLLGGSGRAAGQLCTGLPFDGGHVQAFGRAETIQGERTYGVGVAYGSPHVFGRVTLARTTAWNWERGGREFRAAGGWVYPGGPRRLMRVCFTGSVAHASGPFDISWVDASGSPRRMDLGATSWSLGVSAGAVRPATHRPQVYPTGSFAMIGTRSRRRDRFSRMEHVERRVIGLIEAGFGLTVAGMFTVRPLLAIPVGLPSGRYGASLTFAGTVTRPRFSTRF